MGMRHDEIKKDCERKARDLADLVSFVNIREYTNLREKIYQALIATHKKEWKYADRF